jgi:hypothetical protein
MVKEMKTEIIEKIENKQKNIITNEDLRNEGYVKSGHIKGVQHWQLRTDVSNSRTGFGDKQVRVNETVKDSDVCAICGVTNATSKKLYGERLSRHHDIYDEEDPLKYTRLLCKSCHARLHNHLRKYRQAGVI